MNVTQELKQVNLRIEHGELGKVMEWCRENCHADWRIENNVQIASYDHLPDRFGGYYNNFIFIFDNTADQMAFVLKWL